MASVLKALGFLAFFAVTNVALSSPLLQDIFQRAVKPKCSIQNYSQLMADKNIEKCKISQYRIAEMMEKGYITLSELSSELSGLCNRSKGYESCTEAAAKECPFVDALKKSNKKKFAFCDDASFAWIQEYAAGQRDLLLSTCVISPVAMEMGICVKDVQAAFDQLGSMQAEPSVEDGIDLVQGIIENLISCVIEKTQPRYLGTSCIQDWKDYFLAFVSLVLHESIDQPGVSFPVDTLKDVLTLVILN